MIRKEFYCLFILMFLVVVFFTNHGCIGVIGGGNNDFGYSIILDRDNGNFIIVGKTNSYGADNYDGFIASYSTSPLPFSIPFFQLNWYRLICISGKVGNDRVDCVVRDGTDHYVLCGFVTKPTSSGRDLLLAKFKYDGDLVFARAFDVDGDEDGAGDMKDDTAAKMIVDSDGNYMIVGTTFSKDNQGDILVAKFSPGGNFLYAGIIGDPNASDVGTAIVQDGTGDYVVVGYSMTGQGKDIVIIKLEDEEFPDTDKGFSTEESVRIEWANGGDEIPSAIVYHKSSNSPIGSIHSYVVAGHTTNAPPPSPPFFFSNKDLLIFKINTDLNALIWGMGGRYFNTPKLIDSASSLIIADDDNLVAGGFLSSMYLFTDGLIAKFNHGNGDLIWARTTNNISTPSNYRVCSIFDIDKRPSQGSSEQVYIATGYTFPSAFGNADKIVALFHKNSFSCYREYNPGIPGISAEFFDYFDSDRCKLFSYNVDVLTEGIGDGMIICPPQ